MNRTTFISKLSPILSGWWFPLQGRQLLKKAIEFGFRLRTGVFFGLNRPIASLAVCCCMLPVCANLAISQPIPSRTTQSVDTRSFPEAWSRPIAGSILSDSILLAQSDEALLHLYNMRFERADSIFNQIEARYPNHPIGPFLKSLTLWWRILPILTVHDVSLDKAFMAEMARVIDRSDQMLKRKELVFDAAFFKTAALGFRGRLLSDRESWLKAAQDGKAALDYVFELAETDPLNADLLFGVGVYEYFAEAIPEQIPLVRPLMFFFPDGNKERGLAQLELAAKHGRFVSAEAAYFLLQIYTSFQPNYAKSIEYISLLRDRFPQNALFHVLQGRVYFRWGKWELATAVFKEVVSNYSNNLPGYIKPIASQATYYLGRQDMLDGQDRAALAKFLEVIKLEESFKYDSFFRANATLRAGMASDRLGKRKEAVFYYKKVIKQKDHANSRERARKFLKAPFGNDSP